MWLSTLGYTPVLFASTDPIPLWYQFATGISLEPQLTADIAEELKSAVAWQTYSYSHPPKAPGFDNPSIDWEQSIVEGHPTHPVRNSASILNMTPIFTPWQLYLDAQNSTLSSSYSAYYTRLL